MDPFGVLTNRKRAVIALIHSIVFLVVAASGFVSPKFGILHGRGVTADFVVIAIYLIVALILFWLVTISRALLERVYFAACTISATSGLVRTLLGDATVPLAQYARVAMLSCAIGIGFAIVRQHSRASVPVDPEQLFAEGSQE